MIWNPAHEENLVNQLGNQIGFGRLMQLTQQEWRKTLIEKGYSPGGEHACGPCVVATTPCGCIEFRQLDGQYLCDWCRGSGWLTKKVKEIQSQLGI